MNTITVERIDENWTRFTRGKQEVWVFKLSGDYYLYVLPVGGGYLHERQRNTQHRSLNWTGAMKQHEMFEGELTAHLRALEILGE